MMLLVSE